MKRHSALCLALLLLAALTACGQKPDAEIPPSQTGTQTEAPPPQTGIQTGTADAAPAGTDQKTVTVSTVRELVAAIGSDTRVILNPGVYNLSALTMQEIKDCSDAVDLSGLMNGECGITFVTDLTLEAAEPGTAEIVTENAWVKPLAFYGCGKITLKGLVCGHDVEPGTCGGSVIYAAESQDLVLENCLLYGSGTYGVEAYLTQGLAVTGTDIYACTDGIFSLDNSGGALFSGCRFHDNNGWTMFSLWDSPDVLVEDTEIYCNSGDLLSGSISFPDGTDASTICFRNCTFRDNWDWTDPEAQPSTAFENCDITVPPVRHTGYARVVENIDGGTILRLEIDEVVMVNWYDYDLREEYGLTDEDFQRDYIIFNDEERYDSFMASRNVTDFFEFDYYSELDPYPVGWEDFLAALEPLGETQALISYTVEGEAGDGSPVLTQVCRYALLLESAE